MRTTLLFLLLVSVLHDSIQAQICAQLATPLSDRIGQADLIVEGRVIDQVVERHSESNYLQTVHRIRVYRGYGPAQIPSELRIATWGGVLGDEATVAHPSLTLAEGDEGLFLLTQSQEQAIYRPLGARSGFLRYQWGSAIDVNGQTYTETELYDLIRNRVSSPLTVHQRQSLLSSPSLPTGRLAPTINAFAPTSAAAGVDIVVTVTGSDFGATPGNVFFRNADDGGSTFIGLPPAELVSWTNTQIQFRVPSDAGSGTFLVQTSGNQQAFSPSPLTIPYALTNVNNTERTALVDADNTGEGGYVFLYSTRTANGGVDFTTVTGATTSFERGLDAWQLGTGFGAYAAVNNCGTTNTAVVSQDGINVVGFEDNTNLLTGNTLGIAFSSFTRCGIAGAEWEVNELDIVFRQDGRGVNWYFGTGTPGTGEIRFETVAIHEIGHTQQLKHIIDPGAIMHFAVMSGGAAPTLEPNDISGGVDVNNFSTAYSPPSITCTGNDDYELYSTTTDCDQALLPVELLEFTAVAVESAVHTAWITATEINNNYFDLERSADGKQFEAIATVSGAGSTTSRQEYRYVDHEPLSGTSYYRIAQYDYDGTRTYSDVVSVTRAAPLTWQISPNPLRTETLHIRYVADGPAVFQLYDTHGRVVKSWSFDELASTTQLRELDLTALPQGIYTLTLRQTDQTQTERIVRL